MGYVWARKDQLMKKTKLKKEETQMERGENGEWRMENEDRKGENQA